jgi:transposase
VPHRDAVLRFLSSDSAPSCTEIESEPLFHAETHTVRKYLRSGQIEPKFQIPDRPSKLDPYAEKLSAWLKREEHRPRKQRRTIKQLYGDLVSLGYDGSYNRVAAFARAWKEECKQVQRTAGRGTFVPLAFAPGEAFQFDWSEDFAVIGNTRTKLQVAHSKLCHSRAFIVRAYLLQTHEMLFDAHHHPFRGHCQVNRFRNEWG